MVPRFSVSALNHVSVITAMSTAFRFVMRLKLGSVLRSLALADDIADESLWANMPLRRRCLYLFLFNKTLTGQGKESDFRNSSATNALPLRDSEAGII